MRHFVLAFLDCFVCLRKLGSISLKLVLIWSIDACSEIDRHAVEEIVCAVCEARQPVSNKCVGCGTVFGAYFCSVCKFWDNLGEKKKVRGASLFLPAGKIVSSYHLNSNMLVPMMVLSALSLCSSGLSLRRMRHLPVRGARKLLSLPHMRQLLPYAVAK